MMNILWGAFILFSLGYAMVTGRFPQTLDAGIKASGEALAGVLSFAGILCLWSGIMNIAQHTGLMHGLSRLLCPVMQRLFRRVPPDSEAMHYINLNLACNILGLGNAATPSGMKAMCALKNLNGDSEKASFDMCLFMVLNTASLQLVPSTMISLRAAAGSQNPSQIIIPVWMVSVLSAAGAVGAVYFLDWQTRLRKHCLTKSGSLCHNSTKEEKRKNGWIWQKH